MRLTSPAFADGQPLPIQYSCAATNVSPPLQWTASPAHTVEEAVVMQDVDASYVHWVMTGIKPGVRALASGDIPSGAVVSKASNGAATYYGPCPPEGKVHHYRITVYALSSHSGVKSDTAATQALATLAKHASAQASLVGTFGR